MSNQSLLYFAEDEPFAIQLAKISGLVPQKIERHRFPDGELKLTLPEQLSSQTFVLRSLDHPNEKLIELLLASETAKQMGAKSLVLIAPYLAYMRQDIAFHKGEAISQKIILQFLQDLFTKLITVDPHLHRISKIEDVAPHLDSIVLSGAPRLGDWIAQEFSKQTDTPILIGPDAESEQWLAQAAKAHQFRYAACHKVRHGDLSVEIKLPDIELKNQAVVLLDDVASSGRTLAKAAELIQNAGARSIDVAVTHALFSGDARETILAAGVRHLWSTDCITDGSNVVSMANDIANVL